MKFTDEGYIINIRKHGDTSVIVTLLTKNYGKITGYAKNTLNKKTLSTYQLGNYVNIDAYSRVEENMLSLRVELISPMSVNFMMDARKLAALSSLCSLCNDCLQEKEPLERFYYYVDSFFNFISEDNWLAHYAFFEYSLLDFLGFGLDLTECAATGVRDNLEFVSPKTGRAVCLEAGVPYKDKLYKFPHFIIDSNYHPSKEELGGLFDMTEFFLNKNFFAAHGLKFPIKRANLRKNVLE
ncbi:MAG: DNA repair protein RecO [Lactobacillaceae bacterium]|jgi:DNA repair protein RecO (recombination protein O)|nr:DNA repair protein RecO [Lactobacillaceae bacterium]